MPSEGRAAEEYTEFEDVDTDELNGALDDDESDAYEGDSLAVKRA
jgi:hypothetical protein